jgi:integrase
MGNGAASHAAWLPPNGAAPELLALYDTLLRLLSAVVRTGAMPALLTAPIQYRADQIYVEARRILLSHQFKAISGDQRAALLNIVGDCLARIDPHFRPPTTVYYPAPDNPFPKSPSAASELVGRVARIFNMYLLGHGRHASLADLDRRVQVGLLVTSVILRQGQCSLRVLTALAATIDTPLSIADDWCYRDIASRMGARTAPERRRVFFDTVSTALYLRIDGACARLFDRPGSEKLGVQARRRQAELGRCFAAFLAHAAPGTSNLPTLGQFLTHRRGVLRLSLCSVLCDYADGTLTSSSFREAAFLRFLGFRPNGSGSTAVERSDSGMSSLPSDAGETGSEQASRGVFDTGGLIADLRRIFRSTRPGWAGALAAILQQVRREGPAPALLVRWLSDLATNRRPGGKKAAAGTILNMLGTLGARLLAAWPTEGAGPPASADELQEIYANILETAASAGHQPRLAAVLSDFDRFYRRKVRPELKDERPELTVNGGYYEISADALSVAEYGRVCAEIDGDESPFSPGTRRDQARAFVIMAWRLGMRRSEILGLERCDFHWSGSSSRARGNIIIRDNARRALKTRNSRRIVPLRLLDEAELLCLARLFDTAAVIDPSAPFFQLDGTGAPVPDHAIIEGVDSLLRRVTGGTPVHPHNLRHAFGSFAFMAMMAEDVGLGRYADRYPFLADIIGMRRVIDGAILNWFRPYGSKAYALSRMLGHGGQEMTFLCYVHTLDLLLFSALDRTCTHGDRRLQRAAVGIPESDRRNPTAGANLLRLLPKAFYRRAMFLERDDPSDTSPATSAQGLDLTRLTMVHRSLELQQATGSAAKDDLTAKLLGLPVPETAAQRMAAVAAIAILNLALSADAAAARRAIRLWSERKLAREDWATMDGAQLTQFLDGICGGESDADRIEILQVHGVSGTKRKSMSKLDGDQLRSVRAAGSDGRYWVRIRDQRAATVRRKLDSNNRKRQSTQKAVSWVLLAAAIELSRMPMAEAVSAGIPRQ